MASQNFRVKNGLEVGTGITISPNGNINSSGISTFNGVVIGGATTSLLIQGNTRIIGILSVGQGTIVLDGSNNQINVGSGITLNHTNGIYVGSSNISSNGLSIVNINASGIVTASSFVGSIAGTASTASFATTSFGLAGSPNITVGNINSSGIVTASSFNGNASSATYATNAGISTYASTSGIATYATNAGISTYATNAGISTYASTSGIATYATNSGIATYATNAGIATYATNSGIATNVSGGTASVTSLSVSGISTLGTLQVSSGIVTASSGIVTYYGDISNAVSGRWILGADGSSNYTFTGIGFTQTANDPTLYLKRGEVYEFVNNSGGSHPFQIRVSNGGAAYNNGVTNNGSATGTIRFEVPYNTPDYLYYQCTNHSSMGGDIHILGTRGIPQNAQTSAYILSASDVGKHVSITTGGATVNSDIFSAGDTIAIYNNSASNQTITQGAGVTLRFAGTSNTGNRTLAQYGLCTVLCVASNTFVISGSGLT